MSNIASPKRIEPFALHGAISARTAAIALATLVLCLLLISFKPYQPLPEPGSQTGGDIINQIGFTGLGLGSALAMLVLAPRTLLASLLGAGWFVMFGFLALSVLNAPDPASALRTSIFTLSALLGVLAVLTLPRDADGLSIVLFTAGILTLAVSYAGLALFPELAKHTADSVEAEHAGLWRGVFPHKNIAGPVMASLSFAGVYLYRRGWAVRGSLLFALAFLFMANTGSKTTLGLVPLVAAAVIVPGLIGLRRLTPVIFAFGMIGGSLATIGIVFIKPLKELARDLAPNLTYTGRTQLWSFSGDMIAKKPWTGYGYESFWGTPTVTAMDRFFDQDWDISNIVHGHNGYLDIAIHMGLPALAAALILFIAVPMFDYARTPLRRENVFLSDFFMMVCIFGAFNALLESFFFRRADPVWLLFFMSLIGLRMTARFAVQTRTD